MKRWYTRVEGAIFSTANALHYLYAIARRWLVLLPWRLLMKVRPKTDAKPPA